MIFLQLELFVTWPLYHTFCHRIPEDVWWILIVLGQLVYAARVIQSNEIVELSEWNHSSLNDMNERTLDAFISFLQRQTIYESLN